MMGAMDPNRERLVRLVAEARKEQGLERQIDLVKATGLSKSTIHRFETTGEAGSGALRAISWAVRWTPGSAQNVLEGDEPTRLDDLPAEHGYRREPMSDDDLVVVLHHVVYDLVAATVPDMPVSRLKELEDRALRVAREVGLKGPRRRTTEHIDDDPQP